MTERSGSLIVRGAAAALALMLSAACTGGAADGPTEPSDAAASPDTATSPDAATSPTPSAVEARPSPTPTPTGPDDEGWAEHLGLTEEELEQRRASDDFLEFAEPRRAREHPRFDETHGDLGLEPAPGDGLEYEEGEWVRPVNPRSLASEFLLPFRDTLLAEGLEPATGVTFTGDHMGPKVDGGYVNRIGRVEANQRQILIAVAFYKGNNGEHRGRVAMAAANVDVIDAGRHQIELTLVDFNDHVADAAVGNDWSETWSDKIADKARAWGVPREFE